MPSQALTARNALWLCEFSGAATILLGGCPQPSTAKATTKPAIITSSPASTASAP